MSFSYNWWKEELILPALKAAFTLASGNVETSVTARKYSDASQKNVTIVDIFSPVIQFER